MKKRVLTILTLMSLLLSGVAGILASPVGADDGVYHYVGWGDTLSYIAVKYHVTVPEIMAANELTNADLIYAGRKLLIPVAAGAYVEHTVVWGDSLLSISRTYGVPYWDIVLRNDIPNPNLIIVGQKLLIPAEGSEAPPAVVEPTVAASTEATPAATAVVAEETVVPEAPALGAGITITSPLPDAEVTSPVTVTGFGAGFENTLAIDILNASGVVIGQGYAMVDAETGRMGPFTGSIEFTAPAQAELGRIQVYSISPRDGAIENLASVSVKLKP